MNPNLTHISRDEIDIPLVHRLLMAQFPKWAGLPLRRVKVEGWDNKTFRLGEDMSVRLPSAQAYAAQVEKEHRWLPRLAPLLPLRIPVPLAMGMPGEEYPWHWSVYRWLEGETATAERISDVNAFALDLAAFLGALYAIDPTGGPAPGPHNFYRGGPLSVYDRETRQAIATLGDLVNGGAALDVWEAALEACWNGTPVWVHGDVAVGNLLVNDGRLSGVIDFGCSAVGDPACDLVIAWTFLKGESREAFRVSVPVDDATWARARGWALWKALIVFAGELHANPLRSQDARHVLEEVIADHKSRHAG